MSLWYQAPQSTFEPRDSRSIGWSQVPNRKAVLLDDDVQSPQHSTGGGTQIDLSNTMSFGAPNVSISNSTGIQLDPTINLAQFGFQNTQDLTVAQYQMIFNQSFSEVTNQINELTNQINFYATQGLDYEARIAALEAWRATGYTGSEIAMRDWSFDGTTITNEYRDFTFAEGLITAIDVLADGTTATTECP